MLAWALEIPAVYTTAINTPNLVLEVIRKEKLDFKVMLGAYIVAEANNYGCPWGGSYSEEQLLENKATNVNQTDQRAD